jgi:hypothetical protein
MIKIVKARNALLSACSFVLLLLPLAAQSKRLWVLKASGELVEYNPITFVAKQTVKLPPGAAKTPASLSVNHLGQVLFETAVTLPLSPEEAAPHKIWLWNGHVASTLDQGIEHKVEDHGSNQALTELAPAAFLSADGTHLFWFANEARRLQREEVDLSTQTTWQAWQTDLSGAGREDVVSAKLPDCRCTTGSCEESCPTGVVWMPEGGLDKFFLVTQTVAGQTNPSYKESARYRLEAGKWTPSALADPLRRVLDANDDGDMIVEAIPDTGCCGWSNQSNDQTVVHVAGKVRTVFDERASYKNPDYDVSFYTSNAKLSPGGGYVATTITATAKANQPIQLAEDGQANPEESKQIRKALAELPAVEVTNAGEIPGRVAFLPHASLVGWISEKEMLIVEDHFLVVYDVGKAARRKTTVRVDDPARVFLR